MMYIIVSIALIMLIISDVLLFRTNNLFDLAEIIITFYGGRTLLMLIPIFMEGEQWVFFTMVFYVSFTTINLLLYGLSKIRSRS